MSEANSALTQPQRTIGIAVQGLPPGISTPDYVSLYNNQPERWEYDTNPTSNNSRATYLGEVYVGGSSVNDAVATLGDIAASTTGVATFNTRTGNVVLDTADITGAGGAPSVSPTLSGVPLTPTAAPGTSTGQIASTAFVTAAIGVVTGAMVANFNGRTGAVVLTISDVQNAGGAPSVSPALTGVPTAPTAVYPSATSQIATTQYVANALAGGTVTSFNGRTGTVTLSLSDIQTAGGAPIASPSFTGLPLVPTAAPNTATTQAASTAFVMNAITASTGGVSTFNGRSGAVTLQLSDVTDAGGAPINSPVFTGTVEGPTPSAGDNSTKLATTAFVETALGSLGGVTTFNGRTGTVTLQLSDVTNVGGAPLASPAMTGTPTSTTATAGDNSTRIATTAFVTAADAAVSASIPAPATTIPLMDGTGSAGSEAQWSRGDHVHPTDTSRAAATALANYLPLTGGALSGSLTVTGTVTTGNYFATGGNVALAAAGTNTAPTFSQPAGQPGVLNIWQLNGASLTQINVYGITINLDSTTCNIQGTTQTGNLVPLTNNNFNCGTSGVGWASVWTYYYGTNSDIRLKRDIEGLPECLGILQALEPKRFKWNNCADDDPCRNHVHWGFVAQDVEHVMEGHEFGGHRVSEDGNHSISYPELVAVLWKAVQELTEKVAGLETTLAALTPARGRRH